MRRNVFGLAAIILLTLGCNPQALGIPTPTATARPFPTPRPTLPPTPGCWPIDEEFTQISDWSAGLPDLEYDAEGMACAKELSFTTQGAIQFFRMPITEGEPSPIMNYMVWLRDNLTIYVILKADADTGASEVFIYPDTWDEDQPSVPPDCQGMIAEQDIYTPSDPSQLLQIPIRGFGKIWCEHRLWETIGYGQGWEIGADNFTVQETSVGIYISAPLPDGTVVKFALDLENGTGVQLTY